MKSRIANIIYILIISSGLSQGQSLSGIISDANGNPIPYATVYISELKHGTTANIKGEYEIKLQPDTYTIFFQNLGYSPDIKTVKITEPAKIMNITLYIQFYQIPEVRVTSTGEDPAFAIMRKAISLAPYYLNRVKHYEAEVYIKGSVIVNKIPKLIQRNLRVNDLEIKEGDSYLIESINKIEFDAPNKYKQVIIAQQSTFPEAERTDISPMDVIKASFYEPVLADMAISPLSPNAMSYYTFKYEGSSVQGNWLINKISVKPKRKSQQVFEGEIYIIENLWCLHSIDLTNNNLAGSINIKQVYTPVQDDIWMPVSHNFDIKVSVVGVKADGVYGSSVTYNIVKPNNELKKPLSISYSKTIAQEILEEQRELSREQEKMEEILAKDNLSNRDMMKLSRLMDKEAEKTDTSRQDLEIKKTSSFTVEKDAREKASTYWAELRPIPLSEGEAMSIHVSDSLKIKAGLKKPEIQSDSASVQTKSSGGKKLLGLVNDIVWGESWHSNGSRYRYGGLIDMEQFSFNCVDGFRYGNDFNFYHIFKSKNTFNISPHLGWAFSRERLIWKVNGLITYNHMKQSRIIFLTGRDSKNYTNSAGIYPVMNMFTSLLFKENYMMLYEKQYFGIGQRQEYFNGFYIDLRYDYEDRRLLSNNTDFSLFSKDKTYKPNIPVNTYIPNPADPDDEYLLSDHIHHEFSLILSYIPRQKYRINNGKKSSAGSDYPTFKIYYDHGINILESGEKNIYDHIQFEANKSRSIGAFSEYSWRLRAGGFINNNKLQFSDFNHFNTQSLRVLLRNHQDAFMLPAYYSLATPEYYIEAHARYTTPYLFLKLLPFLSNSLMRENISLAYLYTPHTGHYYEFGYGLSEVLLLGKISIYVGFEDIKYKSAGFRFTFIFN